jgi:hypothetical protein
MFLPMVEESLNIELLFTKNSLKMKNKNDKGNMRALLGIFGKLLVTRI